MKEHLSINFKINDIGEGTSVLGIRISKSANGVKIDQTSYQEYTLKRFNMHECNSAATPLAYNQKLSENMCPKDEHESAKMAKVQYMEAIGSLLFAAQISQTAICFAVNKLRRFGTNPGKPSREYCGTLKAQSTN